MKKKSCQKKSFLTTIAAIGQFVRKSQLSLFSVGYIIEASIS